MSFAVSLITGPVGLGLNALRASSTPRLQAVNRRVRLSPRASDEGGDTQSTTTSAAATDAPAAADGGGRFKRRDPSAAPPRPRPLGAGPAASSAALSGIKVIPVEQRSRDAFQGVAKVDDVVEEPAVRGAKLVAGDVAAILLFAAIGRAVHVVSLNDGEGLAAGDVFATALPFLIGWFATAPLTGTFGEDARVGPAAAAAAKGWAAGVPAGLVLRSASKGQLPPQPFVIVSMVATGVLLVGWRTWFANGSGSGRSGGGNKKGNPLEFMNLLMGLTKRW